MALSSGQLTETQTPVRLTHTHTLPASSRQHEDDNAVPFGDPGPEKISWPSIPSSLCPLPDILRKFNRNLKGYAVGTGDASETNAFLNQAVPQAKAEYGIRGGSCGESVGGT